VTDFQAIQNKHVQALKDAVVATTKTDGQAAPSAILPGLVSLLDALPYYTSPDWIAAYRGTYANILAVSLPNDEMLVFDVSNDMRGVGSGYHDNFYGGVAETAAATSVVAAIQAANPNLEAMFWLKYSVLVLTDAVRKYRSPAPDDLNNAQIDARLASRHAELLPGVTASALVVYQSAFAPTSQALAALAASGGTANALSQLEAALSSGVFTSEINNSISLGGEITDATVWFLYMLWITLRALGAADVDAQIQKYQSQGLSVPPEVGPTSWWNGGYTTWHTPLSGADVLPQAIARINAYMPSPSDPPYVLPHGWSNSLLYYGPLAWYWINWGTLPDWNWPPWPYPGD
jgi:hypothetical protein